ncbi:MAG: hypothetical protein AAB677_01225 [Patescibacteria group bacterium]
MNSFKNKINILAWVTIIGGTIAVVAVSLFINFFSAKNRGRG